MNKKTATILIIAMLASFPNTAKADLDVLSIIQDEITSVTQKVNTVVKQYSNIQFNLQELSLNRNILSQMRDKVKAELKANATKFYGDMKDMAEAEGMMFLKSSLSSVSLPGVGQYVDMGAFVNPKLQVAVGQIYLKKKHKKDDVKYIAAKDDNSNNLMVDNTATLFANSLVRRVHIIEEDPCRCVGANGKLISDMPKCTDAEVSACKDKQNEMKNLSDVGVVKEKYYETIWNAHRRWLEIGEAMSVYKKMKNEGELNQGNIDEIADITGKMEEDDEKEESQETISDLMQKQREANTLALSDGITNTLNRLKNGDYTGVLADSMKTATDVYSNAPGSWQSVSDIMKNTSIGLDAFNNAYHNAEFGDWGGALNAALGGAGGIVSNTGNESLGNIFNNSASGAGNALSSALNGDWGSAIRNAGEGAGNAVSGSGNEELGAAISAGGSLTDVGINAANSGGNLGNILDNTIGSSQMDGALGAMEGAYDNQNQKNVNMLEEFQAKKEAERKAAEEEAQKKAEQEAMDEKIKNATDDLLEGYKAECAKCKVANGENSVQCSFACSF